MTYVADSLRRQVHDRANGQCEYCYLPENFSFYVHQVDHIISTKHRGTTELVNLAWACFTCNNHKGSDIGSIDEETNQLTPLYNPRTHNWDDHFEKAGPRIVGKTPIGRVTVFLLQLNHVDQIKIRRELIDPGLW